MLDKAVTDFIHEGLAAHIGTRNARLEPNGTRLTAVKVEGDGRHVVAYIPKVASGVVLQDLRDNGQAAIAVARPVDDKACQVKGEFVESWDAAEDERAFVFQQWHGFLNQLDRIGLPSAASTNWAAWPCVAVRIRVTALFDQTPGPKAGAPLS
jgi:hypothetical protein